jgi:hypothetical protein
VPFRAGSAFSKEVLLEIHRNHTLELGAHFYINSEGNVLNVLLELGAHVIKKFLRNVLS